MKRVHLRLHDQFFYMGGGGGGSVQQIQSLPVPTPAPPVTASAAEVVQAEQDTAQQNLMKKSIKKTIFAGDSGGFQHGQGGAPGAPISPSTGYKGKLG